MKIAIVNCATGETEVREAKPEEVAALEAHWTAEEEQAVKTTSIEQRLDAIEAVLDVAVSK